MAGRRSRAAAGGHHDATAESRLVRGPPSSCRDAFGGTRAGTTHPSRDPRGAQLRASSGRRCRSPTRDVGCATTRAALELTGRAIVARSVGSAPTLGVDPSAAGGPRRPRRRRVGRLPGSCTVASADGSGLRLVRQPSVHEAQVRSCRARAAPRLVRLSARERVVEGRGHAGHVVSQNRSWTSCGSRQPARRRRGAALLRG